MRHRRELLAGGAGTLTMWLAAYLWHSVLLPDFYVRHLFPGNGFAEVSVPLLFLGYALLGFTMAVLAPTLAPPSTARRAGLRFGLAMGVLAVAPMTVMIYAVGEVTVVGLMVDMPWHLLVEQPLGGLVIMRVMASVSATGR